MGKIVREIIGYAPIMAEVATAAVVAITLMLVVLMIMPGCASVQERPTVGSAKALLCYGGVDADGVPAIMCVPAEEAGDGEAL